MNKTCLLSDMMMSENFQGGTCISTTNKRGKSLNKTGMIVIDENEDIIDDQFFKKNKKNKKSPEMIIQMDNFQNEEEDSDDCMDQEKSKTANLVDLLYEMKKKNSGQINKDKKVFENTHDISKLKKQSFFSQSKVLKYLNSLLDNIDEQMC